MKDDTLVMQELAQEYIELGREISNAGVTDDHVRWLIAYRSGLERAIEIVRATP